MTCTATTDPPRWWRGADTQGLIDWLQPPDWQADFSQADVNTLRALGIK